MKTLIAFVIAAGVIVGGYFIVKNNPTPASTDTETITTDTSSKPQGKKMAFSQLVAQGDSYKCTVHQYVNDTDTVGTAYISDKKVRGEFSTDYQGKKMESHVLIDGTYAYMWSNMMPTGFKTKVTIDANGTQSATAGTYSFNYDQVGDYDCQPWKADASMFVVPTSISFTAIN